MDTHLPQQELGVPPLSGNSLQRRNSSQFPGKPHCWCMHVCLCHCYQVPSYHPWLTSEISKRGWRRSSLFRQKPMFASLKSKEQVFRKKEKILRKNPFPVGGKNLKRKIWKLSFQPSVAILYIWNFKKFFTYFKVFEVSLFHFFFPAKTTVYFLRKNMVQEDSMYSANDRRSYRVKAQVS